MEVDSSRWFRELSAPSSSSETVDKQSHLPAYVQLAQILRRAISSGTYPSGSRLPAEAALARRYGVSAMTARQAVGVIVEEGLVRRVQGSGTFVQKLTVTASSFDLEVLRRVLADQENLKVRILKTSVERADEITSQALDVSSGHPLIYVERLLLHREKPFTLQVGYARFEPESPVVEMMLDTTVLTGLFLEGGPSGFKKGKLRLLPTSFTEREAQLLDDVPGGHAFRLEHVFYDADDQPAAYGWLLVSPENMPLTGRVGVWDE
jgi:DNA-binding GntR family transcriptional regulator